MEINWTYKFFNALSASEIYEVLKLRSRVFVVEQNCVYLDPDGKDRECWHLTGWAGDVPVAYARIIPPGLCYDEASIGRVVSNPDFRKMKFGRQLMELAIEKTLLQFSVKSIRIGAQLYLLDFYTSLGFRSTEKHYIEDGIPHVEMVYQE